MKIIRIIFLSALLMGFTGVVQAQQWWGAVAFAKSTGIPGGSADLKSRSDAENAAMTACKRKHNGKADDCRILTSFYNGCAAVYWSPKDKHGGVGTSAYSKQQAVTRGYAACVEQGGKNCQHSMSFCTSLIIY